MTLEDIRDWIKPCVQGITSCYIGKTDPSKEKALCLYDEPSSENKLAIGGVKNTSTANKKIRILVQWTESYSETESKSKDIYKLFEGTRATIGGSECFFKLQYDNPVSLGCNDNDIYEFVIDVTIVYER